MRNILLFLLFSIGLFGCNPSKIDNTTNTIFTQYQYVDPLDKMPIVGGTGLTANSPIPIEQRGQEFRKYLSATVKISMRDGSSGSGTICYYDSSKNLAYIVSCGHLFEKGMMSEEEGERKQITCKIIVWYHNEIKLERPKEYVGKAIFYRFTYNNNECQDTSLITFQPDWIPNYFPIAPLNYNLIVGNHYHSCGCDGGKEVAHYDVEIINATGDITTRYNSPRPGRSGGGLLTDDGYYIGTCSRTSEVKGTGTGYFTSFLLVHQYWSKQRNYEFLLHITPFSDFARRIPIINRNSPQVKYNKDYILMPY